MKCRSLLQNVDKPDRDTIEVRFQTKDRKVFENVKLRLFDPLKSAMARFAELRKVPLDSLRFVFDGERLDGKETPMDLDMEDGETIDVVY